MTLLEATLRLAPGTGRIARLPAALLFVPDAAAGSTDELVESFRAASTDVPALEAVAEHILAADFAVPPFACIVWDEGISVMVFGDVSVLTDRPSLPQLSGAGSQTWVEHTLRGFGEAAVLEVDGSDADPATDFESGVGLAGGFELRLTTGAVIPPAYLAEPESPLEPPPPPPSGPQDSPPPDPADRVPGPEGVTAVSRPSVGRLVFDDGQVVELDQGVLLGRNPAGASDPSRSDLRPEPLSGDRLSRVHCEVRLEGSDVYVVDCGSTNGSIVVPGENAAPVRLEPGTRQRIEHGYEVYLGSRRFRYEAGP